MLHLSGLLRGRPNRLENGGIVRILRLDVRSFAPRVQWDFDVDPDAIWRLRPDFDSRGPGVPRFDEKGRSREFAALFV
jgi:hypothetical protein